MDGVCTKCRSPCALCDGHPDRCVSCDGSGGTKYVHEQKCYADCPAGTGPNSNELTCFPCLEGCDLCDIQNITQCLKCTAPSLVHEGGCVNPCPENYVADGISCREWELKDAGIIPFPFLIATLIFIVICLFGRMKKRAFINKGKMAIKSPQNTITCIIICIAPFQFLATIAQAFLSYVYKTNTFCYLAIAVIVLIMSVNMFYAVWFGWKFDSKKIPDEIERKVRLFKMSRKEAEKHKVYKDEKF